MAARNCWVQQQAQGGRITGYKKGLVKDKGENNKLSIDFGNGEEIQIVDANQVFDASENKQGIDLDDMVEMSVLNKPEILDNMRMRYQRDEIFTLIGPTLIVVNPYKHISKLFSRESLEQNMQSRNSESNSGVRKQNAHIYGLANEAYSNLQKNGVNQSIVISGESGAGKTENAKYAMNFLTNISSLARKSLHGTSYNKQIMEDNQGSKQDSVEEKILFCNPIMEAFGNAKTVRNNNSSRFGKFVSILVERDQHTILGALINKYLLEKSRVTRLAKDERNYHIFYHFLSCKQLVQQMNISPDPQFYNYLNSSGLYRVDSIDDSLLFEQVQDSFVKMGFQLEKINTIWSIIATILLLGNVEFKKQGEERALPINSQILLQASKLLQCESQELEKALTLKQRKVGNEIIESPLTLEECISVRDSLSKILYDRLFSWLVMQLNSTINPLAVKSIKSLSIGLLDIFGFEKFEVNSFEQLCINYTNEHLQQLYISYVFKNEFKILEQDGLSDCMKSITYEDNQQVLDVLEKQGVFQLLKDQCSIPTGSDKLFLSSLKKKFVNHPKIQFPQIQKEAFRILHTQAEVEYLAEDFVKKNKDEVSEQIDSCIKRSKNQLVQQIFSIEIASQQSQADKFLGEKFRNQMNDLMAVLQSSEVHFVRCIKPNELKRPDCFQDENVLQQVQYLGVLESIEVRRRMFPARKSYQQFLEIYWKIDQELRNTVKKQFLSSSGGDAQKLVEKIIKNNFKHFNQSVCLMGKTKIYLKTEADRELEKKRIEIEMQLRDEASKAIQRKGNQLWINQKKKSINILRNVFQRAKAIAQVINVLSKMRTSFQRKKLFEWRDINEKLKIQEINQIKQLVKQQQQLLEIKQKDEKESDMQNLQWSGKKPKYQNMEELEDEENTNRFLVSDSKSNMHLIGQEEGLASSHSSMNYSSISGNMSYASLNNVKMEELKDQKRVEELLNQEKQNGRYNDILSQYTSIAKYYEDGKELIVAGPSEYEIDTPPMILHILEERGSFSENGDQTQELMFTTFTADNYDRSILESFMLMKISEVLSIKLKKRRKNLFQTKTIKEVMSVSRKPMSGGPLTKLPEKESKIAVEIFRDILQLMEKKNEANNTDADLIIFSILKKSKNSSLLLKDEVYLQMLKQINNNQNRIELIRVLQLMIVYSYSYKPSLDILLLTLQFLYSIYFAIKDQLSTDLFLNKLFCYLLNKLIKDRSRRNIEKEFPLAIFQVRFIMNLKQIHFPFFLPNGSQYSLSVDPSQTIGEVKQKLLRQIQIPDRIHYDLFGIFQVQNQIDNSQEELISESELAWDLISKFEFQNPSLGQGQAQTSSFFFLLKIKYYYSFGIQDTVSLSFFHSQTSFDIQTKKINLSHSDLIKVACLNILISNQRAESFFIDEILPNTFQYTQEEKESIIQEIQQEYSEIFRQIKSRIQAKLEYISIASNYQEYMSWFVSKAQVKIEDKIIDTTLALKPNMLTFQECQNKKNVLVIKTEQILRQQFIKDNQLQLELKPDKDNSFQSKKVLVFSDQAQEISYFFSKYIDLCFELTNRQKENNQIP